MGGAGALFCRTQVRSPPSQPTHTHTPMLLVCGADTNPRLPTSSNLVGFGDDCVLSIIVRAVSNVRRWKSIWFVCFLFSELPHSNTSASSSVSRVLPLFLETIHRQLIIVDILSSINPTFPLFSLPLALHSILKMQPPSGVPSPPPCPYLCSLSLFQLILKFYSRSLPLFLPVNPSLCFLSHAIPPAPPPLSPPLGVGAPRSPG